MNSKWHRVVRIAKGTTRFKLFNVYKSDTNKVEVRVAPRWRAQDTTRDFTGIIYSGLPHTHTLYSNPLKHSMSGVSQYESVRYYKVYRTSLKGIVLDLLR